MKYKNYLLSGMAVLAIFSFVLLSPISAHAQTIGVNLAIGSRGLDVTNLQTFLAGDASIYPSGKVTGYFGFQTAVAVRRFQARYGLPQVGRVGPQTRAKINELIANGGLGTGGSTSGGTVSTQAAPIITNIALSLSSGNTTSSSTVSSGTTSSTSTGTTLASSTTSSSTPSSGSTSVTTSSSGTTVYSQTATVSWMTDKPSSGKVYYSTIPLSASESMSQTIEPVVSGSVATDPTYTTSKSIQLASLANGTTYYYMIEAVDQNGNVSVTWPAVFSTK